MPHVLVAGKLHPSGIALLEAAPGITFDYVEEVSEPSYAPLIANADALVIRTQPLSAPTVAMAKRLKIVSRHGVGYDAVDLPSLNERGIDQGFLSGGRSGGDGGVVRHGSGRVSVVEPLPYNSMRASSPWLGVSFYSIVI